jgi:hypothetical protein
MAHQIDLFCVPQLADTGCLEADHNGGYRTSGTDERQSQDVTGFFTAAAPGRCRFGARGERGVGAGSRAPADQICAAVVRPF